MGNHRQLTPGDPLGVDELVDKHLLRDEQRAFPVLEDGRLIGLVCLRDVRKTERSAWPDLQVRDIMTPAAELARLAPDEDAADALFTLSRRGFNQLPVVEEGRLRGMLYRKDVLRWLSLYGDRDSRQVERELGGWT